MCVVAVPALLQHLSNRETLWTLVTWSYYWTWSREAILAGLLEGEQLEDERTRGLYLFTRALRKRLNMEYTRDILEPDLSLELSFDAELVFESQSKVRMNCSFVWVLFVRWVVTVLEHESPHLHSFLPERQLFRLLGVEERTGSYSKLVYFYIFQYSFTSKALIRLYMTRDVISSFILGAFAYKKKKNTESTYQHLEPICYHNKRSPEFSGSADTCGYDLNPDQ